jgi:hypothetical protein
MWFTINGLNTNQQTWLWLILINTTVFRFLDEIRVVHRRFRQFVQRWRQFNDWQQIILLLRVVVLD